MKLINNIIKNEISSLTSFRFITAFVIFLFHSQIGFGFTFGISYLDNFINHGAVFMTGFFVLSGYILCIVYCDTDFKIKTNIFYFYLKRFAKIYPTYIIATIVFFIFITPPISYSMHDIIKIFFNDIFLTQAFFPNMFQLGYNGGSWSISVEAFFYFCFPLIMLIFSTKKYTLLIISIMMSLLISLNIYGDVHSNYTTSNIGFYYSSPIMRLNEFMIGIAFFLLKKDSVFNKLPSICRSSIFISLLIFIISETRLSSSTYVYMGAHFILTPLFALLIVNIHNLKSGFFSQNNVLNYLGKISYSFYLWQFIAIEATKYLKDEHQLSSWLLMPTALLINIIISSISFHLIEERCRNVIINSFSKNIIAIEHYK